MEEMSFLRPLLALVMVCCLIGLVALLAKKLKLEERLTSRVMGNARKQLSVVETLVIDTKRRVVLIKRDSTGHLLLLSPQGDTLIEQNIPLHSDVVSLEEHLKPHELKGSGHDMPAKKIS